MGGRHGPANHGVVLVDENLVDIDSQVGGRPPVVVAADSCVPAELSMRNRGSFPGTQVDLSLSGARFVTHSRCALRARTPGLISLYPPGTFLQTMIRIVRFDDLQHELAVIEPGLGLLFL